MKTVNIQVAKTHLSRLVEEAVKGEEIVIAKAGRPCVRLVPYRELVGPRKLGIWKGRVRMTRDFDASDDEIARLFEGESG